MLLVTVGREEKSLRDSIDEEVCGGVETSAEPPRVLRVEWMEGERKEVSMQEWEWLRSNKETALRRGRL